MRWWLKVIASAVFAVASVFVAFLWVRSHWTFDRLSLPLGARGTLIVISYRRSVTITYSRITIPSIWRDSGRSHPIGTRTPDQIWPRERILGFGWADNELMMNIPNAPSKKAIPLGLTGRSYCAGGTGAMFPDWFFLLVLLTCTVLPWRSFKFSLQTLLIVTTLVAILLTIFSLASRAPEVSWENGTLVTE